MKTSGVWTTIVNNVAVGPAPLDANGNPTTAPTTLNYANSDSVNIQVDPPAAGTSSEYVLTYDGTANIQIIGGTIVSQSAGKIVFDVTPTPGRASVTLKMLTMDPADPIHDMHVVRSDQVDLFNAGEIFNPAFVEKVSQWGVLRMMDWGNTNASGAVSWDTRSQVTDTSWASAAHSTGVPLEVMVQLANEAHTDLWYNVPTQADDTYVTNALTYIKDNLDPSLKVHVEYSNEVWNSGFAAYSYAQNQANALWAVDTNGNGTIDASEAVAHGTEVYYGYRSAQIASIAQGVFGTASDNQLDMVLAGQTVNPAGSAAAVQGVALAHDGSVSSLFDDYAVTTYFGSELSSSTAADAKIVLGWAEAGSAGLDAAFHELEYGGALSKNYSLAAMAKYFAQDATFAANNGLNLVAYEGGASFTSQHESASTRAEFTTFFGELMNDPRMGDLYTKMVDSFTAAGGSTLVAYDDIGTNSQYGYWGVLDSVYDTSSPRYDALLAAAQADDAAAAAAAAAAAPLGSTINGTAGNDHLVGTAYADTINGGAGNDYLDGGAGADQLSGGAGNDIYIVDNIGDVVIEAANSGTDEVRTTLAAYSLTDNVENLTSLGAGTFTGVGNDLANHITAGSGDSALFGGGGNDTLTGGAGNDYLDGGTGADQMAGGAGNDIYIVDNTGDWVSEATNAGIDEVRTSLAKYNLTTNVENLTYTGTDAFTGQGNNLDNVITGGSGNDLLMGNDGNDTLIGGAGNDKLQGGTGSNTLIGGTGDDTYWITQPGDQVIENANEGYDLIYSSISYRIPANVEELILMAPAEIWANNQGDKITGTSGIDHLHGGLGADTLIGGGGNDFLYGGGGHDLLTGNAGADTFVFAPGDLVPDLTATATIADFSRADGDKIDLSAIDAALTAAGHTALTFVGAAAFTKHAGELRVVKDGSNYDVLADTNGDGVADFALVVTSKSGMLAGNDFLL